MQYIVLAFALLAAVCHGAPADTTTVEMTTTAAHSGHHVPDLSTTDFFVDTRHRLMVLKTPSGCYATHLTPNELDETTSSSHLSALETGLVAQLKTHRTYERNHHLALLFFSHQIRTACNNMHVYTFVHDHATTQ
ncbi:hypothetical protein ScPMuIL_002954 [Solemya velum]